jgi:hypothetical protein
MAAGLGYIEFATGDILTAALANGYLASQTVMVFADAAARTSAIASPQEGMISYLKDTNAVEYYSGSAWTTVGGGSSGGMTLLSTTSLSGSSTSISPISGSYTDLKIVIYGTTNASANYYPYLKPNGTGTTATWYYGINANGTAVQQAQSAQDFAMNYNLRAQSNANNVFTITISNYSSTAVTKKTFMGSGTQVGSTGNVETFHFGGFFDISGAITSLDITTSAGTFNGGTVLVYGVK